MGTGSVLSAVLALFLAFPGAEAAPLYDVAGELAAQRAGFPVTDKAKLDQLAAAWKKSSARCLGADARLGKILARLVAGSALRRYAKSRFGTCVIVKPYRGGLFEFLEFSPKLRDGVIEMPEKFIPLFKTEDEIAFVLAHEFAHFALLHEAESAQRPPDEKRIVEQERAADELAFRMTANAGYDVLRALDLMIQMRGAENYMHLSGAELGRLRDDGLARLSEAQRAEIRGRTSTPY